MTNLQMITETLIAGDADKLRDLVQQAVDDSIDAGEILQKGLISGMGIVGDKMQSGEMFIPEVLMSGRAMSGAVEILHPLLADKESSSTGMVVIGTVKGDLHDIGKNLVTMMIESSGFEVLDLGVDVAPEDFVKAIQENNPDIVALSALLTTTMPMIQKTIDAIGESGLRDSLKVIIGGAPINQDFADGVNADGYAPDAGAAAKLAKALVV